MHINIQYHGFPILRSFDSRILLQFESYIRTMKIPMRDVSESNRRRYNYLSVNRN